MGADGVDHGHAAAVAAQAGMAHCSSLLVRYSGTLQKWSGGLELERAVNSSAASSAAEGPTLAGATLQVADSNAYSSKLLIMKARCSLA